MAASEQDDSSLDELPSGNDGSVDSFLRAAADISGDSAGAGARTRASTLREGVIVAGRYRLKCELGEGGMGVVWEAVHTVTRRSFALKFLKGAAHQKSELRARFLREARLATAVDHPNVVQVLDVFEFDDGTPVMAMERLVGETLGRRLAREGRLSLEVVAGLLLPVVSAVGTAHALGIVHRDLKPENIFVVEHAPPELGIKVLDFGVAKLAHSAKDPGEDVLSTETGALLGTACYMAPEQALAEKDVDHRADLWALGVILYECLAGERPVPGTSVGQVVARMMSARIKPIETLVPALPADLTSIVGRLLTRQRTTRPSAAEIREVLERHTKVRAPAFGEPMPGFLAAERANESPDPVQPSPDAPTSVAEVALSTSVDGAPDASTPSRSRGRVSPLTRAGRAAAVLSVAVAAFVAFRTHPPPGTSQGSQGRQTVPATPVVPASPPALASTADAPKPPVDQPVAQDHMALPGPIDSASPVVVSVATREGRRSGSPRKLAAAPVLVHEPPAAPEAPAPPVPEAKRDPPTVSTAPTVGKGLAEHVPF